MTKRCERSDKGVGAAQVRHGFDSSLNDDDVDVDPSVGKRDSA